MPFLSMNVSGLKTDALALNGIKTTAHKSHRRLRKM